MDRVGPLGLGVEMWQFLEQIESEEEDEEDERDQGEARESKSIADSPTFSLEPQLFKHATGASRLSLTRRGEDSDARRLSFYIPPSCESLSNTDISTALKHAKKGKGSREPSSSGVFEKNLHKRSTGRSYFFHRNIGKSFLVLRNLIFPSSWHKNVIFWIWQFQLSNKS